MPSIKSRIVHVFVDVFFRDPARPVELISLGMFYGWAQFLLSRPQEFLAPRYVAFSALPPNVWAAIIITVIFAQVVAIWPSRYAAMVRFVAMAAAAGLWTVIAIAFWTSAGVTPLSARTTTVMPIATVIAGVYLGLFSRRP